MRQPIESCTFFKLKNFLRKNAKGVRGQGVPRMTAAASLRDSSSVLEADLGKEGKCRRLTATCFPFRCILPCMGQNKAPPLRATVLHHARATPAPRTATGHAVACPALGLLSWQRPSPPTYGMASSDLPVMNRSSPFNPPVQGSVPCNAHPHCIPRNPP